MAAKSLGCGFSPGIYLNALDARYIIAQFHRPGNPVFVPEFTPGQNGANLVLWMIGEHDALGFPPFGIDRTPAAQGSVTLAYVTLRRVQPLVV